MQRQSLVYLLGTLGLASVSVAFAQGDITPLAPEKKPRGHAAQGRLVEEFTADTLDQGEFKVGSDLEYGVLRQAMIGTDVITTALGAPTFQAKWQLWDKGAHRLALGFRAAYLTKETLLWGTVGDYYKELKARMVRPQVSWSHQVSPRLTLHTFWSKGLGTIQAKLSEKGRRDLWEAKHPGAHYDDRDMVTQAPTEPSVPRAAAGDAEEAGSPNQEKAASERSAITTRTTQVQSIAGLAQERFQITGEFVRDDGNKILVTSRIEQTRLEQLRSSVFRLTLAHQWIASALQIRLGVGGQYYALSGKDLDGEMASDAGFAPASDISFYFRF